MLNAIDAKYGEIINYCIRNFYLQDCQCSLSDPQATAVLGGCCPLADGTLLCYRCRMRRGVNDN